MWPYTLHQRNQALQEISAEALKSTIQSQNITNISHSTLTPSTPLNQTVSASANPNKASLSYILNPHNEPESDLSSRELSNLESAFSSNDKNR